MLMHSMPTKAYADLGEAWVRHQTARLRQKHLQVGMRFRLDVDDVDALLERAAAHARNARAVTAPSSPRLAAGDHVRRATREAVELCARLHLG